MKAAGYHRVIILDSVRVDVTFMEYVMFRRGFSNGNE